MAKPIRVLIVDDVRETRAALARLIALEADMTVVGFACNGVEAIQGAARAEPDVVLMDICMPVLDGIVATEWLTRLPGWTAPVIVMSAQADGGHRERARLAGAVAYLEKPFSAVDFIELIRIVHARGRKEIPPFPYEPLDARATARTAAVLN
jgi:CheY-like chemotaxis protein